MSDEADDAAMAVRNVAHDIAKAIEAVAKSFQAGGSILYVGAGTSGRLAAMDAAEMPPTFGIERERFATLIAGNANLNSVEGAEDDLEQARKDFDAIANKAALVIGISASGSTPYVCEIIRIARSQGMQTIGIANNRGAPLLHNCDIPILLDTGPELIAGSTRLKAGTAQKICLNAISTGAMVLCGRVSGSLMTHMTPVNEKLRRRAVNIVMQHSGVEENAARERLERANWDLPAALSE